MTNGLHAGMSRTAYNALKERVNWSTLKELLRSPQHYQHRLAAAREDTDAMVLGRCVHLGVFEPNRFATEVMAWTGGVRRGAFWEHFRIQCLGQEILREDDFERCLAIQRAVRDAPAARQYLMGGTAELTVLWTHETPAVNGVLGYSLDMRSRLDFVTPTAIVDLKTARDASPSGFGRAVGTYRLHTQGALYVDAYERATGRRLPYVLLVVESVPPHAVVVYRVPDALLDLGREEYQALLGRLHACRRDSLWPGYAEAEMELTLPRWADDENISAEELGLVMEG